MATEVVFTVGSGKTYSTVTEFFAAQGGDLVTADEIRVAEIYGNIYDNITTSGTTNANCYFIIRAAPGEETTGRYEDGGAMVYGGGSSYARLKIYSNIRFENLRIAKSANSTSTGWDRSYIKHYGVNKPVFYDRCCIYNSNAMGSHNGVLSYNLSGYQAYYRSCVFRNWRYATYGNYAYSGTIVFENCVFVNNSNVYVASSSSTALVYNSVLYQVGGTNPSWGSFSASSSNNASFAVVGDPPPGTSGYGSDVVDADFEDAAGYNFHLSASSALKDIGVNRYSSTDMRYDIDDVAYPETGGWPIGFDYISAVSTTPALSLASLFNLTATSAQPKVTVTF